MKTQLSNILPVAEACQILGEDRVRRIVTSLLSLQQQNQTYARPSSSQQPQALHQQQQQQPQSISQRLLQPPQQLTNQAPNRDDGKPLTIQEDADFLVQSLFFSFDVTGRSQSVTYASSSTAVDSALQIVQQQSQLRSAPDPQHDGYLNHHQMQQLNNVPLPIRQAWKRFTSTNLMLDRNALLKFYLPACAQPHSGPGGHMGLYDCLFYALQYKAPPSANVIHRSSSGAGVGAGGGPNGYHSMSSMAPALVSVPDVIIFLAICKDYYDLQEQGNQGNDFYERNDPADEDLHAAANRLTISGRNNIIVNRMAKWMFVMYDSYQKKGIVTRDTLHRYLCDVYGEDSFKAPQLSSLLDRIFATSASATNREFVQSLEATVTWTSIDEDLKRPQNAYLNGPGGDAVERDSEKKDEGDVKNEEGFKNDIDINDYDTDASDSHHADEVLTKDHSNSKPSHILMDWMSVLANAIVPTPYIAPSITKYLHTMDKETRWLPQICTKFGLAESRLYEVKRRFYSLVEISSIAMQNGPIQESECTENGDENLSNDENSAEHQRPLQQPKQAISQSTFCKAVSAADDELGHGGYLPESLAELVFTRASSSSENYWHLTDVLEFGGIAVRMRISEKVTDGINGAKDDAPEHSQIIASRALVKWIFGMFGGGETLSRDEIGVMLSSLCDHWAFRAAADAPPRDDGASLHSDENEEENGFEDLSHEKTVSLEIATALRLVPTDEGVKRSVNGNSKNHIQVPLSVLVDCLLKEVDSTTETLTVDQLISWHECETDMPRGMRRLGPLMTELRLVATVMFGIPPKFASLEYSVLSELQRRHKLRYPQTEGSRRGPRGTVWYIIDFRWPQAWNAMIQRVAATSDDGQDFREKHALESSPRRLGRINNKDLLRENGSLALRADLKWKHDYEILPPLVWSALQAWYDGGPPIHRTVVPYNSSNPSLHSRSSSRKYTEHEIELYPAFVTVFMCDAVSRGEARPFQQTVPVSRVSPIRVLLVKICKLLDVDPSLGRFWVMDAVAATSQSSLVLDDQKESGTNDWLLDLDKSIEDQRQIRGAPSLNDLSTSKVVLLLEIKDKKTGMWPRGADGKHWMFKDKAADPKVPQTGDGIVGLYNMGNTCYLNSSIQCLSHTPIFRDYFTSKLYLNDINTTNPLGYQGRLARVSAVLINSLWKRFNQNQPLQPKRITAPASYAQVNAPALTPKTFKESLGQFNEIFAGNEQHDAQELLAFLLGGLSEDLNRIVDKPYIEAPDSDGRPDSELADIWWSNHLKREMSIIVALFTGQYKSLLTCRSCKYESARFEPFSFLQLPLPEDDNMSVSLVLYSIRNNTEPMKYLVRVHNGGQLKDVMFALAKVVCLDEGEIDPESMGVANESDVDTEAKLKERKICEKRAQNMAVVDMRESYIFKIAPSTWSLQDLQNKDTGELPLLHVYELDGLPDKEDENGKTAAKENDNFFVNSEELDDKSTEESKEDKPVKIFSFLALMQRRSELVSKNVLHPLAHRIFGSPLLLRVPYLSDYTGKDLYDLVAKRLRNFVPKPALQFLNAGINAPPDQRRSNDSTKDPKSQTSELGARQRLKKTMTDMEEVAAGPVPRYGFRLRIVTRDGRRCALCPWYDCCVGCFIPDDDFPTVAMCGDSIDIDWHMAVDVATSGFGIRSNPNDQGSSHTSPFRSRLSGLSIKNHSSCGAGSANKGYAGAITLEDCLDAFAKEERIPEAYCSKCKDFRVQTKRMSLWRLPPVVIIQLKRFQFTQHMRRKLRDFVAFPIEGLDLSRIMAFDNHNPLNTLDDNLPKDSGDLPPNETEEKEDTASASEDESDATEESTLPITNGNGRSNLLYDLYAVVHHQGALSGGHYIASLKSELDGQWRMFNDAQIYEINSRDVVDPSAYILFYIRRDATNASLSDFWDTTPREGEGMSEEDIDKLIRGRSDRCVIQ